MFSRRIMAMGLLGSALLLSACSGSADSSAPEASSTAASSIPLVVSVPTGPVLTPEAACTTLREISFEREENPTGTEADNYAAHASALKRAQGTLPERLHAPVVIASHGLNILTRASLQNLGAEDENGNGLAQNLLEGSNYYLEGLIRISSYCAAEAPDVDFMEGLTSGIDKELTDLQEDVSVEMPEEDPSVTAARLDTPTSCTQIEGIMAADIPDTAAYFAHVATQMDSLRDTVSPEVWSAVNYAATTHEVMAEVTEDQMREDGAIDVSTNNYSEGASGTYLSSGNLTSVCTELTGP